MSDEKRHKGLEITIYISQIILAGILAGAILVEIFGDQPQSVYIPFFVLAFLTLVVSLILSVIGLFKGSRLLREHLLLWYGLLFAVIFFGVSWSESIRYYEIMAGNILFFGFVVVLIVLPVIWLGNVLRS